MMMMMMMIMIKIMIIKPQYDKHQALKSCLKLFQLVFIAKETHIHT